MAANNYYGAFTHGGTQYGNEYTAAYSQYNTAPSATPGTPSTAYPPSNQAYAIPGYTRPANQAAPGTPTAARATTSAAYSNITPTISAPGTSTYAGYTDGTTTETPKSSFTNYDAAVYNAVSVYAQGTTTTASTRGAGYSKKGFGLTNKKGPRFPPKPQTLHYCDVCKISCAGPQTYKEHLEGQKHKKKETLMKAGTAPTVPKGSPAGLRCELCDVTCTGNDAYAAHLRGAKHQKVVKLHTKLGKPIPSDSPTVIPPATTTTTPSSSQVVKKVPVVKAFVKPPAPPPKVNFVTCKSEFDRFLHTDPSVKPKEPAPPLPANGIETLSTAYPPSVVGTETAAAPTPVVDVSNADDSAMDYIEKEIEPVGMDYIEEIRTDDGRGTTFNCKLCDCKFNDPNAKEMHMKGRRHRLQYKKKVDPSLIVDIKPSTRQKKIDERRARTVRGFREGYSRMRPPLPLMAPMHHGPPRFGMYPHPPSMYYMPPMVRRMETRDDRHIMSKHGEIYPKEDELQAIQRIVSTTEKALKFVSDEIAEETAKKETDGKVENTSSEAEAVQEGDLQAHRILKGVMRVGNLAKGLLLRGDSVVHLVVLCSVKPTVALLTQVLEALPAKLKALAPEEDYCVTGHIDKGSVCVESIIAPAIEVTVAFTSPLVRAVAGGEATATLAKDPEDLLDKEHCLDALAALRHAKWFQARATTLHSCVIIIRILKDLCKRTSAWACLNSWVIELLAEKAISSAGTSVGPGESLRLVFEALAAGVLLSPFGAGLVDPCEKEVTDATAYLSRQEKIDATQFAQRALRQLTFGQIYMMLGIEELPFGRGGRGIRKRQSDAGIDNESNAGKSRKVEEAEVTTPAAATTIPPETVATAVIVDTKQ